MESLDENGSESMQEQLKANRPGELAKAGDKAAYHVKEGQKLEASKRHT